MAKKINGLKIANDSFAGGKVTSIGEATSGIRNRAAAKVMSLIIVAMMYAGLVGCSNSVVPNDINAVQAIELLNEVKPYLYNSLIASDYKWTNTLKEGSTPKTFEELSKQYIDARTILSTNSKDAKALANANEALYGMGKSIMLAEICNGLGIDIKNVVRFQYDGSIWHGNGQGGEPRYAWITYTNTFGKEISKQIQINGDLNYLSINSDVCASNNGVPQDRSDDDRNQDLDDIYAALIRAIVCEAKFYPEGIFRDYPCVSTGYSEENIEIINDGWYQQDETASKQIGPKVSRTLSTHHKDKRFVQPYLRHRR